MEYKLLREEKFDRKSKAIQRQNKLKKAKIVRDKLEEVRRQRAERHVDEDRKGKQLERNTETF